MGYFVSCEKFELPQEAYDNLNSPDNIASWIVEESFDYANTSKTSLNLSIIDNAGKPVKNVPFKIYSLEDLDRDKRYLCSGISDSQGTYHNDFELNRNCKFFTIEIGYPGYVNNQIIPIAGSEVLYTIDPKASPKVLDNIIEEDPSTRNSSRNSSLTFNYIGTYSSNGVPDYLESVDETIGQDILDLLAASLPEGQPVPNYNPQYISSGNTASVIVDQLAEIWITFVHEGAGYQNSVGYYTYPTSTPPETVDDITDLNIIFPNCSFSGSGGGLTTGNKVYLGTFNPGTTVGWFLIPNGWDGASNSVIEESGKDAKFANTNLNDFTSAEHRSHCVVLEDPVNENLFLGFEDINRPGGDKDFNDAIFLIDATPFSAIITDDLPKVQTTLPDSDGDGVPDNSDEFINDPDIAFVSYMPGENTFGTLAFEDRWPSTGDYDLNDIVIDYNFSEFRNINNQVIKTRATFVLRAMGAGLKNGFGFETNLLPSQISSVAGSILEEGIISVASNGVEENQGKATIIVFDNGYNVMNNPGGFVNTEVGQPLIEPDTIVIDIEYTNPIPAGDIGFAPYNPFIFTGLRRGYEIHLPDYPPTSLVDNTLFQTLSDDSNPGSGKYYKTVNNLPWALNFPSGFDYPIEKTNIKDAYSHFQQWVLTSGGEYPDWYYDNSGYRINQFIY